MEKTTNMTRTARRIGMVAAAAMFASVLGGVCLGSAPAFATEAAGASDANEASSGAAQTSQAGTVTLTDCADTQLTVPAEITSVVDIWPAHNQIMMLLGVSDVITTTTTANAGNAWVAKIFPEFAALPANKSNDPGNTEDLLKQSPQLIFTSNEKVAEELNGLGIACAYVTYGSYNEMLDVIDLTASLFGEDAQKRADEYRTFLTDIVEEVETRLADMDESEKQSVLYLNEYGVSYGSGTIVNEWITKAGGVNAFEEEGSGEPTTEAILVANPDIIVTTAEKYDEIMGNEAFASLDAVQSGRVYIAPKGTFSWSQYGVETALQVLWTAQLLYPETFADIDMVAEVQEFYRTFFDYELTADEAQLILDCKDPE